MTSLTALRSRFVHPLPVRAGRISLTKGEAVLCSRFVEEVLSAAIAPQFNMNEARTVAIQRAVLTYYRNDDKSVINSSPLWMTGGCWRWIVE